MLCLISSGLPTYSQINFPLTADFQASFTSLSAPVNNTGADMSQFISSLGGVSMVKCWDGAAPTWSHSISNNLQKEYAINGTTLGTVSDPDIVIEPINGDFVMIVYELNGRIYYEIWNWNGVDYSLFQVPTIVSGGNLGSNPNIDVNLSGEVAITWEEIGTGNEIYALVGNIDGTGFGASTLITTDAQRPDIAISRRDGLGSSDVVISLTYIRLGSGDVALYQLDHNTLSSGLNTPISASAFSINDFGWGSTSIAGSFQYPRIASIHLLASAPFQAYHQQVCIAVDYQCTNGAINPYTIYSMTRVLTSTSPVTFNDNRQLLNKPNNLFNQLNEKPVVTYAGEFITVAWNGDLNLPSSNSQLQDIISRRLYLTGNPWVNNTYSIVNLDYFNNQTITSVCGRYASGEVGFTFYSDFLTPSGNTEVLFKESNSRATSYRIGQTGSQADIVDETPVFEMEVYPNPANEVIHVKTNLIDPEISIFSNTGKLVKRIISNSADLHKIDLSELSLGSYTLLVVCGGKSRRVPIIKVK
jgi:hypothetical protein